MSVREGNPNSPPLQSLQQINSSLGSPHGHGESSARLPPHTHQLPTLSSLASPNRHPGAYFYHDHPPLSGLGQVNLSGTRSSGAPIGAPGHALQLSPATPSGLFNPTVSGLKRPRSERPEEIDPFDEHQHDANGQNLSSGRLANAPTSLATGQGSTSTSAEVRAGIPPREGSFDDQDDSEEKGGNGRALKQTKRAAQNRAAQQAFRKRKEERIRELEDKEKVLQKLLDKEQELLKRELDLSQREKHLAHHAATQNTSSHGEADPSTRFRGSGPNSSPHNTFQSMVLPTEDAMGQKWYRELEAARLELGEAKRMLSDKDALCESLRRSLEDMGAENRSLRSMINTHGLRTEIGRAKS